MSNDLHVHLFQTIMSLHQGFRILVIIAIAVAGHFTVRLLKHGSQRLFTPKGVKGAESEVSFTRRYPKLASLSTVLVSTMTFAIYFLAIGLVLKEFKVSLKAYLASASVIGLAIGFGTQGLVQDVVTGLTLIFSDALHVGDVVQLGDQFGKVENIGLRFTKLISFQDQTIYIPNRNMGTISRFYHGYVRVFVDIEIPEGLEEHVLREQLQGIAAGLHAQYPEIILKEPEFVLLHRRENVSLPYLRFKFRVCPGQVHLVENVFKQRVLAAMRALNREYQEWMITVVYRAE